MNLMSIVSSIDGSEDDNLEIDLAANEQMKAYLNSYIQERS